MSTVDGLFTVNDVVKAALRKSGIIGLGQVASGADVLDAQDDLADMLAQWNVKTWLVWDKVIVGLVSTGQTTPYTVGPGGQYSVTPRPDRIEAAFVRILNSPGGLPVDTPIKVVPAAEQWATVALKTLVAIPKLVYYDPAVPLGQLNCYPWPQAALYSVFLVMKNVFPLRLPLNLSLADLPPATRAAMKFNLARRLRQGYGKGLRPDPELNALAKDSLETLCNSQVQIPELRMPAALGRPARYNIYGDTSY